MAQKTKAQLTAEIDAQFPTNGQGEITAAILRGVTQDMVDSWQQIGLLNQQTGTTYTFLASDQGKLVTFNNAAGTAVTLPAATGDFGSGYNVTVQNVGASGTTTITVSAGTINGAASITLTLKQVAWIVSSGLNTYRAVVYGDAPATITVGTSSVTGGTSGRVLYDNAGVLGEYAQIPLANGGTNASLTASNGGIFYSTATAGAILSGTATAGQIVRSGSSAAPSWSTATFPSTTAAGTVLSSGTANTIAGTATPTLGVTGSLLGTLTLAGNTSGAVLITPQAAAGTTTLTAPNTSGTIAASATAPITLNATTGAIGVTASALTKVDDTNVTLTLGGTPTTALLAATSITAGWTGTLAAGRLNANVVQAITNDTNVTGSIAAQNLTFGWTGQLSPTRGGTGSNLSATGGTGQVLKQATVGGNVTVGTVGASELSGLGTGVATALAVNINSPGAMVLVNGAAGTPSGIVLTNGTGLPISTGLTGAGTGVLTALGVNVGSAGAFVTFNGALGTPSSGTLTSATGLPISTGLTGAGTGVLTALGVNVGTAGSFVVNGGALGSPSSAGTIPAFTLGGTISGGGNQINNVIIGTSTPLAGSFTTVSASTSVTSPINYGGSAAGSTLTIQSTSGAGTTDAVIVKTGNNVEAARWDTNQKYLIGLSTAQSIGTSLTVNPRLQLAGSGAAGSVSVLRYNGAGGGGGLFYFGSSNGAAVGTFSALVNGSGIGTLNFFGDNGVDYSGIGANIICVATETWSASTSAAKLNFNTTISGATTASLNMTIESGNVVVGSGSALATSATLGFFHIDSCAGTPTGVPAKTYTGSLPMVYDSTNNKLYVYNGAWKGSAAFT